MGEFEVFLFEVEVAFGGDGHQVDMGVRDFEADDGDGDAFARDGFLDGFGHFLGEDHHLSQFGIVDIEDIVRFVLRHHEGMALGQRIDIEKREEFVILSDFIARDLTLYDS